MSETVKGQGEFDLTIFEALRLKSRNKRGQPVFRHGEADRFGLTIFESHTVAPYWKMRKRDGRHSVEVQSNRDLPKLGTVKLQNKPSRSGRGKRVEGGEVNRVHTLPIDLLVGDQHAQIKTEGKGGVFDTGETTAGDVQQRDDSRTAPSVGERLNPAQRRPGGKQRFIEESEQLSHLSLISEFRDKI